MIRILDGDTAEVGGRVVRFAGSAEAPDFLRWKNRVADIAQRVHADDPSAAVAVAAVPASTAEDAWRAGMSPYEFVRRYGGGFGRRG